MITNIHTNPLGTISFEGKFSGMRKAQHFTTYPMQDSGHEVTIQSETRIGTLDLKTGKVIMCKPVSSGAYFHHLAIAKATRKTVETQLDEENRALLVESITGTGGVEVGSSVAKCDNTGAIGLSALLA